MTYVQTTVVSALVASFIGGLAAPLTESKAGEALFQVASIIVAGAVMTYWLRRDNAAYQVPWSIWRFLGMWVPLTSLFVFLWYFVKTRGGARGMLAFLSMLLLSVGCLGLLVGGAYVAFNVASQVQV